MKLRSGALLIGLSIVLVSLACSSETVKEVPVDRVVIQEVIKEVPVEKIVEVEKEVVRTVEVEKVVTVEKEVVKEVEVPGKTIVVEVEKEVVRTVEVEKPVIVTQMIVATPTAVPVGAGPSGELRIADAAEQRIALQIGQREKPGQSSWLCEKRRRCDILSVPYPRSANVL